MRKRGHLITKDPIARVFAHYLRARAAGIMAAVYLPPCTAAVAKRRSHGGAARRPGAGTGFGGGVLLWGRYIHGGGRGTHWGVSLAMGAGHTRGEGGGAYTGGGVWLGAGSDSEAIHWGLGLALRAGRRGGGRGRYLMGGAMDRARHRAGSSRVEVLEPDPKAIQGFPGNRRQPIDNRCRSRRFGRSAPPFTVII